MNFIILILAVVTAIVGAYPWSDQANEELNVLWESYKIKFGKKYEIQIESFRRKIWEENMKFIQIHNFQYNIGMHKYFLGVNEFADLTHEEFKSIYLKYKLKFKLIGFTKLANYSTKTKLPDSVNWVKKGYVTQVKNQGQCGSCWAFSTTGSMEGQYFKNNKRLVSLSEQQLVDCSSAFGNEGCNGGLMDNAFQYIMQYGLEKENDYPYTAQDGECDYSKERVVAYCKGYNDINQGSEADLAEKLATVGPISVGIDASNPSFQFYHGGVYDEENCSSTQLDHGVLAVGYGIDEDSEENYWLVKNSWGRSWGIKGYIKMSKDKNNQCGIATKASYPVM